MASDEQMAEVPPERGERGERIELKSRSADVRARAGTLVERCVALHANSERLRQERAVTMRALTDAHAELRSVVAEYVGALRGLGASPEATLILAKELVEQPANAVDDVTADMLRTEIVASAIDAYFVG